MLSLRQYAQTELACGQCSFRRRTLGDMVANHLGLQSKNKGRKMSEKRRYRILTPEEEDKVMAFLAKADPDEYPIYWLAVKRGLRIGEITSNHREADVYVEGPWGSAWKHKKSNLPGLQIEDLTDSGVHVKGKKGHDNFVHLPKMIVNMLKHASGKRTTGPIFHIHAAKAQGNEETLRMRVKYAARDVGIEDWQYVKPHGLRHGFGYKVARQTKDVFKVRDMLRHDKKNINSASVYVHEMSDEEKKQTLEQLDQGVLDSV